MPHPKPCQFLFLSVQSIIQQGVSCSFQCSRLLLVLVSLSRQLALSQAPPLGHTRTSLLQPSSPYGWIDPPYCSSHADIVPVLHSPHLETPAFFWAQPALPGVGGHRLGGCQYGTFVLEQPGERVWWHPAFSPHIGSVSFAFKLNRIFRVWGKCT